MPQRRGSDAMIHTRLRSRYTAATARRRAFTLIELMIVVSILGVLAAIAIPSFVTYVRRSKTSEATGNLKSLYLSASTYYQAERTGRGATAATSSNCTVGTDVTIPTPGPNKQKYQSTDNQLALGFSISDYVYYSYQIESIASQCGWTANAPEVYYFRAWGDLDGDGDQAMFELAASSDSENLLYHARGFYVLNETE
jgi:prepilin-type N-terminal cleavage/methylation domain-containing protein